MSSNMQRYGNVLAARMKKTAGAFQTPAMELGTIGQNLSLTVDSLKGAIPKGDYMVNITLTGTLYKTGRAQACPDDGGHVHDLPRVFRGLQGGERVLVAWCGNEPVVIAVVVGS